MMLKKRIIRKSFVHTVMVIVGILVGMSSAEAKTKAKKSAAPEEILQKGRMAFFNYDFDEARDYFEEYRVLKEKARQAMTEDFEILENRLNIATNSFDRVQKIEVVDSINMPRDVFYKAYHLAQSAGKIGMPSSSKLPGLEGAKEVSYLNEDGDYFITPVAGPDNTLLLKESRKLLDGTWETRDMLEGDFEQTGDYAYPFLDGDGQTFYFANNGDDSMGGYDIFVVQKDPLTGISLQPLNVGMPFNSPYDDFMMAIDEETGLGWWATDRHDPGGDVTIYVYILDDTRQNYPSSEEDLKTYARLDDYKATWKEGTQRKYEDYKRNLKK